MKGRTSQSCGCMLGRSITPLIHWLAALGAPAAFDSISIQRLLLAAGGWGVFMRCARRLGGATAGGAACRAVNEEASGSILCGGFVLDVMHEIHRERQHQAIDLDRSQTQSLLLLVPSSWFAINSYASPRRQRRRRLSVGCSTLPLHQLPSVWEDSCANPFKINRREAHFSLSQPSKLCRG